MDVAVPNFEVMSSPVFVPILWLTSAPSTSWNPPILFGAIAPSTSVYIHSKYDQRRGIYHVWDNIRSDAD